MKNAYGHNIKEGFYRDEEHFHYYHIKETPEGFMKREANETNYSELDQILASTLCPLIRQDELARLIISAEKENSQSLPKCTGQYPGEFGKDWEYDEKGHRVPVTKTHEQIEKPWAVYSYAGPLGIGRIIKDRGKTVDIQYSEGQIFPLRLWGSNYINRFNTLAEAIDYFLEKSSMYTKKDLEEKVHADFPNFFSQTPSKCTERPVSYYREVDLFLDP